ncbi:unnamed protein product [Tenebrio molitor]|nr:unnamed protein product [Tenebrio molitor]
MQTNEDQPQERTGESTTFNLWGDRRRLASEKTTEAIGGSAENRQSEIALYLKAPLEPLTINPLE